MLARRLAGEVPVLCSLGVRSLASKGAEAAQGAKPTEGADAKAVAAAAESLGALVKEGTPFPVPTTIPGGQAYPSDMRSVSGLGIGDGIANHTRKWMQVRRRVAKDLDSINPGGLAVLMTTHDFCLSVADHTGTSRRATTRRRWSISSKASLSRFMGW